MVPFFPVLGSRFPYKVANPKKGALIIVWLLGYQVLLNALCGALKVLGVFNVIRVFRALRFQRFGYVEEGFGSCRGRESLRLAGFRASG